MRFFKKKEKKIELGLGFQVTRETRLSELRNRVGV